MSSKINCNDLQKRRLGQACPIAAAERRDKREKFVYACSKPDKSHPLWVAGIGDAAAQSSAMAFPACFAKPRARGARGQRALRIRLPERRVQRGRVGKLRTAPEESGRGTHAARHGTATALVSCIRDQATRSFRLLLSLHHRCGSQPFS